MRFNSPIQLKILFFSFMLNFIIPSFVLASNGGITGRTLKTRTTGCGSCHGSTATPAVNVIITGPDTVILNQATTFTLMISGGPAIGAGCDIATRYGTLGVVSPALKLLNGELTHITNTAMVSGSISFQFSYTYGGTQTIDTIFANGLSTNSNGSNSGDQWNWAQSKRLVLIAPTNVDNETQRASGYQLVQNFPNPFNPTTSIYYTIPNIARVSLKVYDMSGKEVAVLVNEVQQPGDHNVQWNGEGLPSGIYFYQVTAGNFVDTKKMALIK